MEQIVDKLNKIAKKIDDSVELPTTDLITDSLDVITKALGGTPNDSNLIVDKLDDIAGVAEPKPTGNIELTENGENINVAAYATATVNVSGGGSSFPMCTASVVNTNFELVSTSNNFENGLLTVVPFPENSTTVCHFLYTRTPLDPLGEDIETIVYCDYLNMNSELISNMVNCSYNEELNVIIVTDPTQNCSFTIQANAWAFN